MDKKPLHLGLHRGLPPFVSDEADREQLNRGPRLLGKSLATSLVRQSKATPAEKKSGNSPKG